MTPEYSHAVEDGELKRISVSQIQKFDDAAAPESGCNRRWYFRYVERLPDPAGKAAQDGTDAHARLEHYLTTGEDVRAPLEKEMGRFLPEPKEPFYRNEVAFDHPIAGVQLVGRIDLINESQHWIDNEGNRRPMEEMIEIGDFKFTSSLQYAKTPAELASSIQMVGYAHVVGVKTGPLIRLSHLYGQTKGRKEVLKVSSLVTSDYVEDFVEKKILPVIGDMKTAASAPNFAEVRPNFSACNAYHKRCPFFQRCHEKEDSLTTVLHALNIQVDPNPQSLGDKTMPLLDRFRGNGITPANVPSTPPAPPSKSHLVALTPPDAPPVDPVLATQGEEGAFHTGANGQVYRVVGGRWIFARPSDLADREVLGSVTAPAPVTTDVAEAAPKRRGRPRKDPTDVARPFTPEEEKAAQDAITAVSVQVKAVDSAPAVAAGFSLYYRCVPKGDFKRFEDHVDAVAAKLASVEKEGIADIRVSKHNLFAYKAWVGTLGTAIRECPPAPGSWVCLSEGEIYSVAADALASIATQFVRGV